MKNNFPIKYALMPIEDQVGWIPGFNELERDMEVAGYLVSKCYIISEFKTYFQNGQTEIKYEVIFPYPSLNSTRQEPRKTLYGEYSNTVEVDQVYDRYEEAVEQANTQNHQIFLKKMSRVPFDKNYQEKYLQLQELREARYLLWKEKEEEIMQDTKDLIVGNIPKEQSIIIEHEGQKTLCNISLYQAIQLLDNTSFIAYNVEKEQYEAMKQNLDSTSLVLKKPLLKKQPNTQKIQIYNPEKKNSIIFYLKDDVLYYEPAFTPCPNEEKPQFTIYTQETYEDILMSYYNPFIGDVLTKELSKKKK